MDPNQPSHQSGAGPTPHRSLFSLIMVLALFWLSVHLLRRVMIWSGLMRRFRVRAFLEDDDNAIHNFRLDTVSISYTTSVLNSPITRLGMRFQGFWKHWFNFGVVYAILASLAGILVLMYSTFISVGHLVTVWRGKPEVVGQSLSGEFSSDMNLSLMIPGITLPLSHLPLYILSFLLAGVVHELGHGIAGAAHGVPLILFGVHFSLIYPSAFTELEQEKLNRLDRIGQMRIISGGVWHNLVLALFAGAAYRSNLFSLGLLYTVPPCNAPIVTWLHPLSPLVAHVSPSDTIVGLDDYPIKTLEDWNFILSPNFFSSQPLSGYCVNKKTFLESTKDCCAKGFHPTEEGRHGCFSEIFNKNSLGCVDAVEVLNSGTRCSPTELCRDDPRGSSFVDLATTCVNLNRSSYAEETWIKLTFLQASKQDQMCSAKETVYSYDSHANLARAIHLDMTVPRYRWIPRSLPTMINDLLMYIQAFSFTLGIFNVLPIFYLDGEYLLSTLTSLLRARFPSTPHSSSYELPSLSQPVHESSSILNDQWAILGRIILISTSALLGLAVFLSFVNLLAL